MLRKQAEGANYEAKQNENNKVEAFSHVTKQLGRNLYRQLAASILRSMQNNLAGMDY